MMAVPAAVIARMISKWEPLVARRVVWIGEDLEPIPDVVPLRPSAVRFHPRVGRADRRLSGPSVEKPCAS
jgi:hypothetical protein